MNLSAALSFNDNILQLFLDYTYYMYKYLLYEYTCGNAVKVFCGVSVKDCIVSSTVQWLASRCA